MDTDWYLEFDSRVIRTDGLDGPQGSPQLGDTATYPFVIHPPHDWGDTGDNTAPHLDRYNSLLQYASHAGAYVTYKTPTIGLRYLEQHTGDSLLVHVRPGDDVDASGVWGLVESVDDKTSLPRAWCQVDVKITVLGQSSDYLSRDDIRAKLETGGL